MKNLSKNGFTLVELSIVLVIIGLLVGGVLQGRELIAAAERNNAISEMTSLSVAINTFRLQYDGFSGDFNEAQDYWGTTGISNGNGDGKICCWPHNEFVQFWIHLEKAELYNVSDNAPSLYTKIGFVDDTTAIVSHRLPLSGTYWSDSPTFKMKFSHGLYLYSNSDNTGAVTDGSLSGVNFLHPIDKKIDDGLPGQGNIIAKNGANTPSGKNCVIDNGTDSNKYNLSSETASDTCIAMWYFE